VVFEALNEGLFRAYFTEGRNIGDPQVLRDVAQAAGVPAGRVEQAWSDTAYEDRLDRDREAAAQIGITGIPVFIVDGRWILEGAVPVEMLREAAKKISAGKS
jgi:predicted DsbA family dithiol-disulfide isomerase